jgi:hypothetical protein
MYYDLLGYSQFSWNLYSVFTFYLKIILNEPSHLHCSLLFPRLCVRLYFVERVSVIRGLVEHVHFEITSRDSAGKLNRVHCTVSSVVFVNRPPGLSVPRYLQLESDSKG